MWKWRWVEVLKTALQLQTHLQRQILPSKQLASSLNQTGIKQRPRWKWPSLLTKLVLLQVFAEVVKVHFSPKTEKLTTNAFMCLCLHAKQHQSRTDRTSLSSAEISSTISARRAQGVSTETASKITPLCNAASFPEPESTVVRETPCRTLRRAETACKASVAPMKKETSVTPSEVPKPFVKHKHKHTGASAKAVIKSVGGDINVAPHECKSPPAAPQPSTVIPPESEQQMPHKELSMVSGTKTVESGNQPKVGKYCFWLYQ